MQQKGMVGRSQGPAQPVPKALKLDKEGKVCAREKREGRGFYSCRFVVGIAQIREMEIANSHLCIGCTLDG